MIVSDPILEKVRKLVEDVCRNERVRLYDVEFVTGSGGAGRTLRVFVDQTDDGSLVSLENCAKVSRGLSEKLDAEEDAVPGGEYSLEVSSPGLDRSLREPWHFEAVIGSKIELRTKVPLEEISPLFAQFKNRSKVTGKLVRVENNCLFVEADGVSFAVPMDQVAKSNKIYEFENKKIDKKNFEGKRLKKQRG